MSAVPKTQAVESLTTHAQLPAQVRELLRRGTCTLAEAGEFLGFAAKDDGSPSSTVYAMAARYRMRTQALMFDGRGRPRPFPPSELVPKMAEGRFTEVPNTGVGLVYVVDTRYLVPMRYPAVGWPR